MWLRMVKQKAIAKRGHGLGLAISISLLRQVWVLDVDDAVFNCAMPVWDLINLLSRLVVVVGG